MGYIGPAPTSGFISNAKERYTGITTAYVDLNHSISSLADVIVWWNGVKQDATNLTLTSSTRITLGGTLVSADIVEVAYLGKAVSTQAPATGQVTNDMLAGSIANSKLANSSITLNGSAVSLGGSATVGSDFGSSYFVANRTSDETHTNSTLGTIGINNEIVDVGGNYNTSNYRYTAPSTGYYFFYSVGFFHANASSQLKRVEFYFKKNSSNYVAEQHIDFRDNEGRMAGCTLNAILSLSSGDYIEWWAMADDTSGNPTFKANTGSGDAGAGNQFGGWRIA